MKTEHVTPQRPEQDTSGAAADPETSIPLQPALTPEEIEELKKQAAKAKDHWDQFLRTTADFDNFKKRAARERLEASKFANESLLQKLIPVLDNFDSALSAAQGPPNTSAQSLQTGIAMIHLQLKSALAEAGLEEIDADQKPFDPNWHEALSEQETAEIQEGHVVKQLRKGYKLRDRLVRPAGVVVAKRPAA